MEQPKDFTLTDVFRKIDSIMDKVKSMPKEEFEIPSARTFAKELIAEFPNIELGIAPELQKEIEEEIKVEKELKNSKL